MSQIAPKPVDLETQPESSTNEEQKASKKNTEVIAIIRLRDWFLVQRMSAALMIVNGVTGQTKLHALKHVGLGPCPE